MCCCLSVCHKEEFKTFTQEQKFVIKPKRKNVWMDKNEEVHMFLTQFLLCKHNVTTAQPEYIIQNTWQYHVSD